MEQDSLRVKKPFGGWAPGNYNIICLTCNKEVSDCDKRAISCLSCAETKLHESKKQNMLTKRGIHD